jgi:hypothetical protein
MKYRRVIDTYSPPRLDSRLTEAQSAVKGWPDRSVNATALRSQFNLKQATAENLEKDEIARRAGL